MLSVTIYSNGDETIHTKPWWVSNHSNHLMSGSLIIKKPLHCYMKNVWWELLKTTYPIEVIYLTWRVDSHRPNKSTSAPTLIPKMNTSMLHQRWALMCFTNNEHQCTFTKYEHRCTYTGRWASRIENNIFFMPSMEMWKTIFSAWMMHKKYIFSFTLPCLSLIFYPYMLTLNPKKSIINLKNIGKTLKPTKIDKKRN